jgi:7-cyano-7-deazaguanine reductase
LKPRFLEVVGDFNPRGNVKTIVKVSSEIESDIRAKNTKTAL